MRVFLSYAVGPVDATIAARLRAVAAAYDIAILLPDRTLPASDELTSDTLKKIKQSDAIIGLLTRGAQVASVNVVNRELRAAAQNSKPIIALVEQGVPVQGIPESQIVYFNPLIPNQHEPRLMAVLDQIRQQQQKKDLTALGWIAGIALGLVALSKLLGDKK
jgi:anion-transporting  ArsA/GET3 family ATPase